MTRPRLRPRSAMRRRRCKRRPRRAPVAEAELVSTIDPAAPVSATESANAVVLEYCTAVRGILNDDQGGPLQPPGLRMADALSEVRESIQRNLDEKKGGSPEEQLDRLAGCIDRGLDAVKPEQEVLRKQVEEIQEVADTLDPEEGNSAQRQAQFQELIKRLCGPGGFLPRTPGQGDEQFPAGPVRGWGRGGSDPRQSRFGALVSLTQRA